MADCGILSLARAVTHHGAPASILGKLHGLDCLAERTDLVGLDEECIRCILVNRLLDEACIRDE